MKKTIALTLLTASILTGCANGDYYKADTYSASQLNEKQEAKTIKILSITPAKVKIDNSQNQKEIAGAVGILSAIGGAFIGANNGSALAGGAIGGAVGAGAGSLVGSTVLVDGVTIGYSEDNHIYTSTQVGKMCEFKQGVALVVTTKANETRIQPNAQCPKN